MRLIAAILALCAALCAPALAQPVRTANVEAELHSARVTVAPSERFTLVLRQRIREHWHTYWRNPGDSGEPTELTWRLPPGAEAGSIQWPTPEAIPFAMLVNFGYSGEVLFPVEVTAPADARPGETLALTADAYWLVCSDVCIPEEATLSLFVDVAAQGDDDPTWAPRIRQALQDIPRRAEGFVARVTAGEPARLSVALPMRDIRNVRFFPYDRDAVLASAPQRAYIGPSGVSFSLTPGVADNLGQVPLEGVVAYETQSNGSWVRGGVEISAEPGEVITGTDAEPAPISEDYTLAELEGAATVELHAGLDAQALAVVLLLAFLGGLILNVMPCVLPVLSIKALAFAGGVQVGQARRHGSLYFLGVLTTFMALACVLIALRGAGEAVGWGFQLQIPWVTSGLALLFFAIGLNLLGVFDIGGGLQNAGAGLAAREGDAGAFFTGALAVIAATPCTAPFMAGAIGAALTQSPSTTLLIFVSLAFGFALPLTLLHFAPGLQRLMPKPGAWMERAKQVLAFPMFATAVWLAWVLAEQTGPTGVLALLAAAIALAFALFVSRWGRVWLLVGIATLALTAASAWRPLLGVETQATLVFEPWSRARVAELQAQGRGVFVNFTAAWCVTCKVNEATSLQQPRVARAFAEANASYLVGDWTNRDDEIAAVLAEHGRAGVPLYLYYPPNGGEARVMPQVLSQDMLLQMLEGETR